MPFAIESAVGLSALTLRVAGAAVDGLFHVTAVGVISIVQIAVSGGGGSGNVSESVVTECAVGRRGREVGKSPGSEVLFASGIRRGCAQLRRSCCFVFKLIR